MVQTLPDTPLIPVADFFANPDRASPKLSPDNHYLSYLAPAGEKQILQIFVQPLELWRTGTEEGRKQVTNHPTHDIREYKWTLDSSAILFLQDKEGNEDFHLFHVDLETLTERNLTPFEGAGVGRGLVNNDWFVEHTTNLNTGVLTLNKQDARRFDLYRLDLVSGDLALHTTLPDAMHDVVVDKHHAIRAGGGTEKDSSTTLYIPPSNRDGGDKGEWERLVTSTPLDSLHAVKWTADNKLLFVSSVKRNTVALVELDPETKEQKVISEGPVDVGEHKSHPATGKLQFVSYNPGRIQWTVLDESLRTDFDRVAAYAHSKDADFEFVPFESKDDEVWIVRLVYGDAPPSFILYHRNPAVTRAGAAQNAQEQHIEFLFTSNSKVAALKLGRMASVNFTARDGLPMQAYVTYPPHFQEGIKFPMVLLPHGGPWHRDVFGYSAMTQWLANRGYIVLQPNFRGSTGFNKTLLTSGFKQWGRAMHTDLLDAVEYADQCGIVDREHVAIFGGSYGGYAALCGVTLTPEFFTCAVDIVGPSNLKTLLATVPPYWEAFISVFHTRMGHPEHDSEMLDEASPITHAHKIVRPLMIAQGKNDPRIKEAESDQIVQAIEKNGGSVYYVMYPDEGHGFARPVNRIDHFQKAELFLSKYMGDKVRTQEGLSLLDNVEGSTAIVRIVGDLAQR
ncbi:Alpha/Beta hydrolase protein [Catenaria anguillulae PL171]|uniref:Dipeptidyl-peptidase V n=1 Tax=Catenaria anguillulae PL171 TaxID=765915 RepID=A0A1Y2HP90_9FUNG|nr:Alpha/Beta hydrolase protein [Catenaria anguillulae PL171]